MTPGDAGRVDDATWLSGLSCMFIGGPDDATGRKIREIAARLSADDGFVRVPREATEAMMEAAYDIWASDDGFDNLRAVYAAMISTADRP